MIMAPERLGLNIGVVWLMDLESIKRSHATRINQDLYLAGFHIAIRLTADYGCDDQPLTVATKLWTQPWAGCARPSQAGSGGGFSRAAYGLVPMFSADGRVRNRSVGG